MIILIAAAHDFPYAAIKISNKQHSVRPIICQKGRIIRQNRALIDGLSNLRFK